MNISERLILWSFGAIEFGVELLRPADQPVTVFNEPAVSSLRVTMLFLPRLCFLLMVLRPLLFFSALNYSCSL